jgi:hypothetical protein
MDATDGGVEILEAKETLALARAGNGEAFGRLTEDRSVIAWGTKRFEDLNQNWSSNR